ncbi:MAG: hypothetical protein QM706_00960 [Nitrospira sp.]
MARQYVRHRMDRHAFDSHAAQRADDVAGDGTAVGYQYLLKQASPLVPGGFARPVNQIGQPPGLPGPENPGPPDMMLP